MTDTLTRKARAVGRVRQYGELCARHSDKAKQTVVAATQTVITTTHNTLDRIVLAAIVANTALLVWSAVDDDDDEVIEVLDTAILWFFVFELALRIKAAGRRFYRDKWLVFDILIITLALLPLGENMTALRILRGARLAHLAKHLPHLRHVTHLRWFGLLARRIKGE
jgi:Ion transport protein